MSVLGWIVLAGLAMSALALVGATGNFIYIALADLLPEITTSPSPQRKIVHTASFAGGLALLWAIALVA